MAAHSEEFASRGQKNQTCLILSSRPRKANFSPKFPRTRVEMAGQTASRGSLLSSFFCAAGLTSLSLILIHFEELLIDPLAGEFTPSWTVNQD